MSVLQKTSSCNSAIRAPLLWLLVPLMIGCWLADQFDEINSVKLAWIALAGAYVSSVSTRFQTWCCAYLIAAIAAGSCYYDFLATPRKVNETWLAMPVRELELDLHILRSFEREDPYGRVAGIAKIQNAPPVRRDLKGKRIYFQLKLPHESPLLVKGTMMQATGLLEPRSTKAAKGFERYLDNTGVAYTLKRGVVNGTPKSPGGFSHFCRASNEKLESILRIGGDRESAFADIATAMMLGKKSVLQTESKERYVSAGVMHLFAISG